MFSESLAIVKSSVYKRTPDEAFIAAESLIHWRTFAGSSVLFSQQTSSPGALKAARDIRLFTKFESLKDPRDILPYVIYDRPNLRRVDLRVFAESTIEFRYFINYIIVLIIFHLQKPAAKNSILTSGSHRIIFIYPPPPLSHYNTSYAKNGL